MLVIKLTSRDFRLFPSSGFAFKSLALKENPVWDLMQIIASQQVPAMGVRWWSSGTSSRASRPLPCCRALRGRAWCPLSGSTRPRWAPVWPPRSPRSCRRSSWRRPPPPWCRPPLVAGCPSASKALPAKPFDPRYWSPRWCNCSPLTFGISHPRMHTWNQILYQGK